MLIGNFILAPTPGAAPWSVAVFSPAEVVEMTVLVCLPPVVLACSEGGPPLLTGHWLVLQMQVGGEDG